MLRWLHFSRHAPAWVPAVEVRGEGIFVQFNEVKLATWLTTSAAKQREHQILESHMRWRRARKLLPLAGNFPGLRYVLLYSFAHALMRQYVLECGYTATTMAGSLQHIPSPFDHILSAPLRRCGGRLAAQ